MKKTSYEVKIIEDNNLFNDNDIATKIEPALILNYLPPFISLPFIYNYYKLENPEKIKELAQRAKIDFNDIESINKNTLLMLIVSDICETSSEVLKKDGDQGISLANLTKKVLETKVLPFIKEDEEKNKMMSVEDLMSKLYATNEVGGKVK